MADKWPNASKSKKAASQADLTAPYQPTPAERETLEAFCTKQKESKPAPRMKVAEKNGVTDLAMDHAEPAIGQALLMEALGTRDHDFFGGLIKQLCNVGSQGRAADEAGLNFMLSIVKGIEPRDHVEAMLAAQMGAVHNATMTFARRLVHVDNIAQQDSAERAFNKLARTFAAQIEALKKYRSQGAQTVRVEHVTVNDGGQAIVGNVSPRGRGATEKPESTS